MTQTETFVPNRYEAWQEEHFEWPDVQSFGQASQWQDGIHTIGMGDAPAIDLLFKGDPLNADVVPVFFNGAISEREHKAGPFFSGQRIANAGRFGFIAVSDPSTNLHKSLGLAWYAGNRYCQLQDALTEVLRVIADRSGKELLLIGGSGGGFASLYYGHRLGSVASVLVWNPQINILRYNAQFVKNYLSRGFEIELPEHGWQQLASEASKGLVQLTIEESNPRRLLYMQNASDWHVQLHTAPFLSESAYVSKGDGIFETDPNHVVFVAHYGEGHAALPENVLRTGLAAMLDADTSSSAVADRIVAAHAVGEDASANATVSEVLGVTFNSQKLA